jgi:hypothetical protein
MINIINELIKNKVNIITLCIVIFSIFIILTKNINIFTLGIVFFTYIIQQVIIIINNKKPIDNSIKYGDLDNIKKNIEKNLLYRADLLNSNKMTFDNWVKYNYEHDVIKIDNKDFYFFIFQYINNQDDFLTLVHANKNYVNLAWKDVMKSQKEYFPFVKEETNEKLIHNMQDLGNLKKINSIKYFWTDPLEKSLIKKESYFMNWYDNNDKKKGVIGIGYNTNNILTTNTIDYSNYIHYLNIIILNVIVCLVICVIFFIMNHKVKSLIFLSICLLYINDYIQSKELLGSFETENLKVQSINSSILGISFLVGINVFILSSLKREIKNNLFIESGIIFSMSLMLLLLSMFKITNFMNIRELMEDRISNQLFFNFCILLNLFVIINYVLFIISRSKGIFVKFI